MSLNSVNMQTWLYFFPFIAALVGWLISRLVIFIFIKKIQVNQQQIAAKAGEFAAAQLPVDDLAKKLSSAESVEKILPFAEIHIDEFLRYKLPAAMPMLAMFISDKLVADMKEIFMKELKELFPALINQYITNAKNTVNISSLIADKIAAINIRQTLPAIKKIFFYIEMYGAIVGFITGLILIFLTRIA